jgi:hypothetical protein
MKAVFIDEVKSGKFILVAVLVDLSQIPQIRKSLMRHRLKGQSRIHFVDESNSRRRSIVGTLKKHSFETKFFVCESPREAEARRKCLETMIASLNPNFGHQIWLELDENHLALDRNTISATLAARGMSETVQFMHATSRQQAMLWIPDAMGWIMNRGGDWAQVLSGMHHEVIQIN